MKTFATKSTQATRMAIQAREGTPARSGPASASAEPLTARFIDGRPEAIAQRRLLEGIGWSPQLEGQRASGQELNGSAYMVAQREQLGGMLGATAQLERGMQEEEALQGRFAPLQRQGPEEEEELLQGRFAPLQRQSPEEEEELLQGKSETLQRQDEEEEELQMKKGRRDEPSASLQSGSVSPANHTGLPEDLRTGIESLSGISMHDVKVHYNSSRPAQINALAYAQGKDVHVAPRQEQHLPHEAWHVVQQAQGRVRPTVRGKGGLPVNADQALEREADEMGAKAKAATTPDLQRGSDVPQ